MENEKFFWTILVAAISAVWLLVQYLRDRYATAATRSSNLIDRLLETDKILIEHADIQKYISLTSNKDEKYFLEPDILNDMNFYKAKSLAYRQINIFDEILSYTDHSNKILGILSPPAVIELDDWETYIKRKLRHPMYSAIMNTEAEIFGKSLRDFWTEHKMAIQSEPANPFVW
jgi:hypothetical protein